MFHFSLSFERQDLTEYVAIGIILAERWASVGSTFVYAEQEVFCSVMLGMILFLKNHVNLALLVYVKTRELEHSREYEYCFTSLSAQSWQYRDRKKPEAGLCPTLILNDFKSSS